MSRPQPKEEKEREQKEAFAAQLSAAKVAAASKDFEKALTLCQSALKLERDCAGKCASDAQRYLLFLLFGAACVNCSAPNPKRSQVETAQLLANAEKCFQEALKIKPAKDNPQPLLVGCLFRLLCVGMSCAHCVLHVFRTYFVACTCVQRACVSINVCIC